MDSKFRRLFGGVGSFVFYILCMIVFVITLVYVVVNGILGEFGPGLVAHWVLVSFLGAGLLHIGMFCRTVLRVKIPTYLDIYLLVLVVAHFFLGTIFRAFDFIPFYDKALHTLSGGALTVVGFSIANLFLSQKQKDGKPYLNPNVPYKKTFLAMFALGFSLMLGLVWEFFEFIVDTIGGTNMQRWQDRPATEYFQGSGLIDTMMDLIVHTIGAIIIVVFVVWWLKKHPHSQGPFITRYKVDDTCHKCDISN